MSYARRVRHAALREQNATHVGVEQRVALHPVLELASTTEYLWSCRYPMHTDCTCAPAAHATVCVCARARVCACARVRVRVHCFRGAFQWTMAGTFFAKAASKRGCNTRAAKVRSR
jgi:hypothetical protein